MNRTFNTKFISRTIESTPFLEQSVQFFFTKWCKINDSIVPEFLDREAWNQRSSQGILEKNEDGTQTLFLPNDLHLWEFMDIVKTVDADTFSRRPDKKEESATKIQELGLVFEKAGLYISEYLSILKDHQARSIAQDIANQFYQYGLSLQHEERKKDAIVEQPALSAEDKSQIDEWFLGAKVYKKRLAKLGLNPTNAVKEEMRKKILKIYFQALAKKGSKKSGEKPWETKTGPIHHLQDTTVEQVVRAVETPARALDASIFNRGLEKLITEMKVPSWREVLALLSTDFPTEILKLYNFFEIPKLKKELEEIRKTNDPVRIANKELQIAKRIQETVRRFSYEHIDASTQEPVGNIPSEMIKTGSINCVGASMLGGALMDEVGIKYVHATLPSHAITFLLTSDGKVYWQDFTPSSTPLSINYTQITSDMIEGDIPPSTIFQMPIRSERFVFKSSAMQEHASYINQLKSSPESPLYVNIFNSEVGSQINILTNIGATLLAEEAIKVYQKAISLYPQYTPAYNGLGSALFKLGRSEEAVEAYREAINRDSSNHVYYFNMGNALFKLGKLEEAIEAYQKFIDLSQDDSPYIEKAKAKILFLQNK